jgi:uncharacterized metal-binding protein
MFLERKLLGGIEMASGKTHEKINIFMMIFFSLIATAFLVWDIKIGLLMVAGYLVGTYWMNPDLDIRSRPYNNWSVLKYFWKPYQKLGHRSIWTHGYIIGDIIRYIYLFGISVFIVFLMSFAIENLTVTNYIEWSKSMYYTYEKLIIAFIVGNMFSSAAHIFVDHLGTGIKKIRKKIIR